MGSFGRGILVVLLSVMAVANVAGKEPTAPGATASEEQAAAERYVANLRSLLATRIVPALRRGILNSATSRPSALAVEVTDDPSPYSVAAKTEPDGSTTVRLSIGYTTLHDAALDAVALSAALRRPRQLHQYLRYQWWLGRENQERRARREPARHAMTFVEFVGLDPIVTQTVFGRPDWRQARDAVETDSLGWTVAYLLVRADPKLAGPSLQPSGGEGAAAARLAAASGLFPVPPFATALGLVEIVGSTTAAIEEGDVLCRAAQLMEDGIVALRADTQWSSLLREDIRLQRRVTEIRSQILGIRRDGGCASAPLPVLSGIGRNPRLDTSVIMGIDRSGVMVPSGTARVTGMPL